MEVSPRGHSPSVLSPEHGYKAPIPNPTATLGEPEVHQSHYFEIPSAYFPGTLSQPLSHQYIGESGLSQKPTLDNAHTMEPASGGRFNRPDLVRDEDLV